MFMKRVGLAFRSRDWAGVAIEFAIVVLGIFVALQVDDWNKERTDRQLEKVYVARLAAETRGNLDMIKEMERIFEKKIRFILELPDMDLDQAVTKDPQAFMRDLDDSSWIGIANMLSGTYDELVSAGRLSLIRDERLRTAIANNLNDYRSTVTVEAQPIGDYRRILFDTLSGRSYYDYRAGSGATDAAPIIASVEAFRKDPRFKAAANAEITYGSDTLYWLRFFSKQTEGLLARLEASGSSTGSPADKPADKSPWRQP
jgi:hypothetical protein